MPSLQQHSSASSRISVTSTTTHEVKLSPSVKRKLSQELRTYIALREQKKALELAMKKHASAVEDILGESGQMSLEVDGHRASVMTPIRKKLDPKRLVALGVSTDIIAKATTETPGTPWVKISKLGEKDESDE